MNEQRGPTPVHFIPEIDWTTAIADALDAAMENDIIVVPSYDMLRLTQRALQRRSDGKYVRLVTRAFYEREDPQYL